jgi:hypothetical protein
METIPRAAVVHCPCPAERVRGNRRTPCGEMAHRSSRNGKRMDQDASLIHPLIDVHPGFARGTAPNHHAPPCHSEGGAALHRLYPDTLAPTEESTFCCSKPVVEPHISDTARWPSPRTESSPDVMQARSFGRRSGFVAPDGSARRLSQENKAGEGRAIPSPILFS